MSYPDEPFKNVEGNVAGSNPLSSGSTPQAETQPQGSEMPSGASEITPPTQSTAQSQQPSRQSSRPQRASSGMFTNIQKYVEKNKPQAQKIAQAVTGDVSSQAAKIRQEAQGKQQQVAKTIGQNQARIAEQRKEAENIVQGITSGQPTTGEGFEQQQERFQELSQGPTGLASVQDLNLGQQNLRAQALGQLAGRAGTEQGRRDLLKSTFQKQGDYTSGMSGLDQLITGGSQAARDQFIQGTKGTAEQLQQNLGDIQRQSQELAGQYGIEKGQFGEQVSGLASEAVGDIDADLQQAYKDEIAARQALGEDYNTAKANVESQYSQYLKDLGSVDNIQDVAKILTNADTDLWGRGDRVFGALAEGMNYTPGVESFYTNLTPEQLAAGDFRLQRVNENQLRKAVNEIANRYNAPGMSGIDKDSVWKDIWEGSKSRSGTKEDQYFRADSIVKGFKNLAKQLQEKGTGSELDKALQQATKGQQISKYLSGEGLDKYDVASQEQIDKYNALQQLLGSQQLKQVNDPTKVSALQDILKRYR